MQLSILSDTRLDVILLQIDSDPASHAEELGCPFCGGKLHSARYRRKPRFVRELSEAHRWRFSLCRAEDGCRRRVTPASVRFLGRRAYLGVMVVLVTAMTQGVTGARLRKLREELGIDRRTLSRWRHWWCESFPATRFWKAARSRLMPPPEEISLPASRVRHFATTALDGVVALLRFLSPVSLPAHAL